MLLHEKVWRRAHEIVNNSEVVCGIEMVPNSEESNDATEQPASKVQKGNKNKNTPSKSSISVEKDSEEYRKLRERNNEAVKKSRTRTKIRTQNTLDKVEKLRDENSKLEDRIEGLKKELDLLKELFVSHAGTKSMKRLTEVDLDVLIAEASPNNKKNKKGATPYTGRSREVIEKEVLALLGQQLESDDEEPQPSTSREDPSVDVSAEQSMMDDQGDSTVDMSNQEILTVEAVEPTVIDEEVTETYTIVDDGSGAPTIWTTENGEAVVVTIAQDEQGTLVASGVQQNLHDIIEGEILMLE